MDTNKSATIIVPSPGLDPHVMTAMLLQLGTRITELDGGTEVKVPGSMLQCTLDQLHNLGYLEAHLQEEEDD